MSTNEQKAKDEVKQATDHADSDADTDILTSDEESVVPGKTWLEKVYDEWRKDHPFPGECKKEEQEDKEKPCAEN